MLKNLIGCMLLLLSVAFACGARAESFFPENDLWTEDRVDLNSQVDEGLFNQIISAGASSYQEAEAPQRHEKIVVFRKWSDSTVNANVRRTAKYGGQVEINMYGGLARRKEITPSGFALVLCHELGHAYGGAPYVYAPTDLSAEGQSDYHSTRRCFIRVFERVVALQTNGGTYEGYIENNCIPSDFVCRNALQGAHGLADLLALMMREGELPMFETPDPYEAPSTILSYPKTAQCRLDTLRAGVFSELRPRCWFVP